MDMPAEKLMLSEEGVDRIEQLDVAWQYAGKLVTVTETWGSFMYGVHPKKNVIPAGPDNPLVWLEAADNEIVRPVNLVIVSPDEFQHAARVISELDPNDESVSFAGPPTVYGAGNRIDVVTFFPVSAEDPLSKKEDFVLNAAPDEESLDDWNKKLIMGNLPYILAHALVSEAADISEGYNEDRKRHKQAAELAGREVHELFCDQRHLPTAIRAA